MRNFLFVCLAAVSSLATVSAAENSPGSVAEIPIRDLAAVEVSGAQPGPGMWKVSKGDHVMWVLGTLSPLPREMEWQSRDVEQVMAEAQGVLDPPMIAFGADIGFFGQLALVPSLLGVRKNPDDAVLQEVVPPEAYARWLPLKARYLGRDRGVEKMRPIFAAMELYEAAIDKSGLVRSGVIGPVLEKAVKRHGIKRTRPRLEVSVAKPRSALREFRRARLSDLECFDKTLLHLERDLDSMMARGTAWATGDIELLRSLPQGDQNQACEDAAMLSDIALKLGPANPRADLEKLWLDAASKALATNRVTFATLPMREVLKADGYLAKLALRGYRVEAPVQ